jgi:hypothetical protein
MDTHTTAPLHKVGRGYYNYLLYACSPVINRLSPPHSVTGIYICVSITSTNRIGHKWATDGNWIAYTFSITLSRGFGTKGVKERTIINALTNISTATPIPGYTSWAGIIKLATSKVF